MAALVISALILMRHSAAHLRALRDDVALLGLQTVNFVLVINEDTIRINNCVGIDFGISDYYSFFDIKNTVEP